MSQEPVTITVSASLPPMFRPLEIIYLKNDNSYSITYLTEDDKQGNHTLSMRKLNTSRWRLIRWIELKIIHKLLKTNE